MQKYLRLEKLLGVLFSFSSSPPSCFLCSSRFFCCDHPASIQHDPLRQQTQLLQNPSLQELDKNSCHTQEKALFPGCSHGEICRNPGHTQKDDQHYKPGIEQAFSNPGYGELDKLDDQDLEHRRQEHLAPTETRQSGNSGHGKPSPNRGHGECNSHDQSLSNSGQIEQNKSAIARESKGPYSARRILDGLDRLHDQVDTSTYFSLLELYTNAKSLSNGKLVHDHLISHALEHHGRLESLLLEMYCKCDALEDALSLFMRLQRPCEASVWNVMIKTLNEQGECQTALELYDKMQLHGVLPDRVTYISLISVCAALPEPNNGFLIHARSVCSKFAGDIILETAIINMYAKCGRIADARQLFDLMPERNVITWTTFITALAQHSEKKETLQLFYQMHQECQVPNRVTYVSTISACAGLKDLANGRRIHVFMLCNEVDRDVVVTAAFAGMYGNCGSSKDALDVFHESQEVNLVTWNAIIAALVHCGQGKEALSQFLQMQQNGILPDRVTLVSAVDSCSSLAAVKQGIWLHSCITASGFHADVTLGNVLMSMYDKCGKLDVARQIFEEIPVKNLVSWNTIITVYAQSKHSKYACQLFEQMQHEGHLADKVTLYGYFSACGAQKALAHGLQMHACVVGCDMMDAFLVTALITMYGKCGNLKYTKDTFDNFFEHNVITWNALIAAYAQHGEERKALLLFDQLLWKGLIPSEATFVGLLNAFTNPAFLADGKRVHTIILNCGHETDNIVGNALINMYSKCGSLRSAQIVFDNLSERDAISWSTIIGVYGEHGQGRMALEFFDEMLQSMVPDEVTFLNVITACNRSGLVENGKHWFKSMKKYYGIEPTGDHYSCMIDLFGRAGQLEEAESLMKDMPSKPTYTAWIAFLGACRYTIDVTRAEFATQHLLINYPENHQPYVLLSNIYAAAGRRDDAAQVMSITNRTPSLSA